MMLQVFCQVHGRHAAFAEVSFDPVALREGGGELGGDLGHGYNMEGRPLPCDLLLALVGRSHKAPFAHRVISASTVLVGETVKEGVP